MSNTTESTEILVIHVRGNKEREQYIKGQLDTIGFPYTFINDGNVEGLTPDILERHFTDSPYPMCGAFPRTSCAYKHILATKYIIDHNLEGALIIEDDLRIKPAFKEVFLRSMEEYRGGHQGEPAIVNYEESSLMLVPRSKRRKGQTLYRAARDRYAGCLYVSREAAEAIMKHIEKEKCGYPIDVFHNVLVSKGELTYYWSHPCIACQCSSDGSMPTMIPTRPRPMKRLKWFYKKTYKHILYFFR